MRALLVAFALSSFFVPLELIASGSGRQSILFDRSLIFDSRADISLAIQKTSPATVPLFDVPEIGYSNPSGSVFSQERLSQKRELGLRPVHEIQPVSRKESGEDRTGILKDYALLLLFEQGNLMRWESFRQELKGPFFSDWWDSVTHLKEGFWDGDQWVWNLVLHPIQGGTTYYMARSRGASDWEAFAWSVGYSMHFELGPLGQAGIGNIAVSPVDLVLTPVAGFLWFRLEEWLDEKIMRIDQPGHRKILSSFLPARALTHLLRGQPPWTRK